MKKNILTLAIASIAVGANAGTVTSDGGDIVIKTKSGFEAKTADGDYSFKTGGRIQLDYNGYDGVINTMEDESGSDLFFRRGRLEIKVKAKDWSSLVSYNLTGGGSIDQLNTTYTGWGKGSQVTFGQQKENFGLEDTGSSKWITAIERSLPSNAFDTGNTVGVKWHGANDQFTYNLGVFKEGIDSTDNSLNTAVTGRLVYRPVQNDTTLVHIGGGFTARDGDFDSFDSRFIRGGSNKTANKVEVAYFEDIDGTGPSGDELSAYNLEFAVSSGSFNFMSEYFDSEISGTGLPDLQASGYYLQGSYILTGEKRTYKNSIGAFDKVKSASDGGAWEVFLRHDSLEVSDNVVSPLVDTHAGDGDTLTVGVNWYASAATKVAVNYVHADSDQVINGVDSGDALVGRLQFAF